jgi:hypothetical protein
MERERYGRGGGGGGINRYPDVSGRTQGSQPPREERGRGRGERPAPVTASHSSNEPWSDVPPELEALLRAQVAQKPAPSRPATPTPSPVAERDDETADAVVTAEAAAETGRKPRATRKPAAAGSGATKAPAKPRATRKPAAKAGAAASADVDAAPGTAPKRRATRKTAAPAEPV